MKATRKLLCGGLACVGLLGALPGEVRAIPSGVTVYVGYADNLRANPFFPNPWNGSPNTIFLGDTASGTVFDAGAILIQNTSGGPINVNDVFVSGFDNGATYDLWGTPGVLPDGWSMVLTQTTANDSQFDTSDQLINFGYPDLSSGFNPSHPYAGNPQVRVTINGIPTTLADTGDILDTGGFDTATFGTDGSNFPYNGANFPLNESLQWRPIGTTGITNPGGNPPGTATPEPAAVSLAALGLLALGAYITRRRQPLPVRC